MLAPADISSCGSTIVLSLREFYHCGFALCPGNAPMKMNSIMPVSADKAADKTVAPSSLPPPERPPVLQFRLRTMLLVVACLSAAMASIHWLGLLWSSALIFVAVLAAAHMAGNSIGTQLRDRGSLYGRSPPEPPPALPPPVPGDLATPPLGKSTPLSHTAALTTLLGIVAGAVAGWRSASSIEDNWPRAIGQSALPRVRHSADSGVSLVPDFSRSVAGRQSAARFGAAAQTPANRRKPNQPPSRASKIFSPAALLHNFDQFSDRFFVVLVGDQRGVGGLHDDAIGNSQRDQQMIRIAADDRA